MTITYDNYVESIRRKSTITRVTAVSLLLVGGFLTLFVTVASVIYSIEGTCLLIGGSDDRCVTGYNVGPSTFKSILNEEFFWFSVSWQYQVLYLLESTD